MSSALSLAGIYAPICTPFAVNEDLDLGALEANMARYAASGLHGYLALGSNGENRSLSEDERLAVLDAVVRNKSATQLVMAGAAYDAQRQPERFLAAAADLGRRLRPGPVARLLPQADDERGPVSLLRHARGHLALADRASTTRPASTASPWTRTSSAASRATPTSSA